MRGSAVGGHYPHKSEQRPRPRQTRKNAPRLTLEGSLEGAILEFGGRALLSSYSPDCKCIHPPRKPGAPAPGGGATSCQNPRILKRGYVDEVAAPQGPSRQIHHSRQQMPRAPCPAVCILSREQSGLQDQKKYAIYDPHPCFRRLSSEEAGPSVRRDSSATP